MNAPELEQRLERVRQRIAAAEHRAGRPAGSVQLLAVSKRHPAEVLRQAFAIGQRDFGENYLQELEAKRLELQDLRGLRLHMIGHIQSNKAKAVSQLADVVHSVDSVRLARALGRYRQEEMARGVPALRVYVQVKLSQEWSKTGCAVEALPQLLTAVEEQPALQLEGLMLVGTRVVSSDPSRQTPGAEEEFEQLAQLRQDLGGPSRLPGLSLGMSGDLETAVLHGSTCVRVGTDIFGARP